MTHLIAFILGLALQNTAAEEKKESDVAVVEVTPSDIEARAGETVRFTAVAKDSAGKTLDEKVSVWFAAPFDVASADNDGSVLLNDAGEARVGAVMGGKTGFARIRVAPLPVATVEISPAPGPMFVGSDSRLVAVARTARGAPRERVEWVWKSETPAIASVDTSGVVTGLAPGHAVLRAATEGVSATADVAVIPNPVARLVLEPRQASARTGDVIRFRAVAMDKSGREIASPGLRWSVAGSGASIELDGAFVSERSGTCSVVVTSGDHVASASVQVTPRNAERELEVVGRAPFSEFQAAEQWIFGNYAYVSSVHDELRVYDISDPANPKEVHSLKVDARLINDVSVNAAGRVGVLTREGASNRKNGIVFLDTEDPSKPTILSEYTATVSGGVHSAFIDDHYVYLTDDSTGSLRIIDFKDPRAPREVGRWEVSNPKARSISPEGEHEPFTAGRYLHDVYVKDGLAYLAYWRDGLVILDVGGGGRGGSPEKPSLVSQLRFNYNELYGDGWLAGAHAVFRYKNYVFVGDEVFPAVFDVRSKDRIPVRGTVWVVDVTDIANPRKVAEYTVPEGGAHNIWVVDDVLYMGYYTGGARAVDVSGELRGDLYRQGREIARLWTGAPDGFRPNIPFTWGAQPHGDFVYFIDINSGLWVTRLGKPVNSGSLPSPPR